MSRVGPRYDFKHGQFPPGGRPDFDFIPIPCWVPEGSLAGICWCHEMVLELVCGADLWCNQHCRTTPVVLEGFWGQVWPKIGRKPEKSEFRIANEPLRINLLGLKVAPFRLDREKVQLSKKYET